jgi:hypothetical protein
MQGSIRMFVGFFFVFGAVGGMDAGPADYLGYQIAIAVVGLLLMFSGTKAMNNE